MNELVEKSYAKINLCLHVLGRLPNAAITAFQR